MATYDAQNGSERRLVNPTMIQNPGRPLWTALKHVLVKAALTAVFQQETSIP